MRRIIFSLTMPFFLAQLPTSVLAAEYKSPFSRNQNFSSRPTEKFYTNIASLVQEQINLIARIEKAIAQPDANQLRAVRGQLIVQQVAIESSLKDYNRNQQAACKASLNSSVGVVPGLPLREPKAQIYCSLYASSLELGKLAPVLDRLLSRRGELALVRDLPLVSGERQSHPVLSIAPVQHPNLGKLATPFATLEPNLPQHSYPIIGRIAKKPLADYVSPKQPAIAPPIEALGIIQTANELLALAISKFPTGSKFQDPSETTIALDRFAYNIDPQEQQTYVKFLTVPSTGIFRVLPYSAYHRPLNTQQNRLQKSVSERYPFPGLGVARGGFTPSLPLQIVGENFQLVPSGVDYSFMMDLGNVPIEKLDAKLGNVSHQTREFFLQYQPPKQLGALQEERRRFLTGKAQTQSLIFALAKAELNHTYLVRSLQFQLPEIISTQSPISRSERTQIDQMLKMESSDIILAFRPVRRRSDGSYTILWRVLNQLPNPKIEDLEAYITIRFS
jgi:hypothetical protein